MNPLSFTVTGVPAPQGSKRHVGRGILIESSKAVRPWREDVCAAAQAALPDGWRPIDEPCVLWVAFYLQRPVSAPKRRIWPDRKPDIDKLLRSTLDALTTARVVADDARIVAVHAHKRYAEGPRALGADIHVEVAD